MLAVNNANFRFDTEEPVLNGLSLSLSGGEIVALLGPSGCGKSTLLRLIAGLLPRQGGKFEWAKDSKFAFVFQEASLMPWATIAENVGLPHRISGNDDLGAVNAALKRLEIADLADRYPAQVSGGQKMRASIARAIASSPQMLLLDEPFAALDEILRFKMNELILQMRDDLGLATLFVTHSIFEAVYLADRVLVMGSGQIKGSIVPGLDRTATPDNQRSSAAFMIATAQVSNLMADGAGQ